MDDMDDEYGDEDFDQAKYMRELIHQMSRYSSLNEKLFEKIKSDQHLQTLQSNKNLTRNAKFRRPPKIIETELAEDEIVDPWETSSASSAADYVPVIGILTQPVADAKKNRFNFTDYILEVNDNFVKWAGSRTVAIPFDISE